MPDRIPLLKAADMKHMPPGGRLIEATAALQRMLGGHRAPTGATAGTKHASSAESKSGARIGRFPFSATNSSLLPTIPDELSGFLDRISNRGLQIASGQTISIDADPGASCFAGWRAVSGRYVQQPCREPTLQTLCAEQLPPGRACSARRHAARLYAVARGLRCRHMHE